jgi:CelD/BcsL family acetyltransferase involved in cellulose biosynthesis
MTEATMTLSRLNTADSHADFSANFGVAILPLSQDLAALESVSQSGQSGYSCSPHWVGHWAACVNANIAVATASRNGQIILALALEVVHKSGLTIAQFVGGSHANANFPAMTGSLSQAESEAFIEHLVAGLRAKPWSVDAIMFERQLEVLEGIKNPLLAKGSSVSPNVSLHLSVDTSFDAVLETRSAKRKRKRFRSQQRKFEAAGGYKIENPASKIASAALLDQYFAMKAQQLGGKGVANVFGNIREQAFFKSLFGDEGPHSDHHFYLSSLDVGGKTRAIYGSSLHGSRQMVHFTAFADDELTAASPGDFLNFSLVEAACNAPTTTYDLGVGDEGYKRSWCDVETWHRDTVIGITMRGKLAKLQFDATRSAKRWIKNNEKLWAFAKRVRKLKAGRSDEHRPATEDGSEL